MAALQLSFSLRTSAHCKTVHLLGSWDNYTGQLPLAADKKTKGGFKGTFRFQPTTLQQGQRYWYYVRLHLRSNIPTQTIMGFNAMKGHYLVIHNLLTIE
jgi:hypothetical protein